MEEPEKIRKIGLKKRGLLLLPRRSFVFLSTSLPSRSRPPPCACFASPTKQQTRASPGGTASGPPPPAALVLFHPTSGTSLTCRSLCYSSQKSRTAGFACVRKQTFLFPGQLEGACVREREKANGEGDDTFASSVPLRRSRSCGRARIEPGCFPLER